MSVKILFLMKLISVKILLLKRAFILRHKCDHEEIQLLSHGRTCELVSST